MCLLKIVLDNENEQVSDIMLAVKVGRTIIISDEGNDEDEIGIITVNPL